MTKPPCQCIDCGKAIKKRKDAKRCWNCYVIFSKNNPTLHPCYKNGKTITSQGYVSVLNSESKFRRELEHRLVMEKQIGRKLKRLEHIHHINGDKADNRPENLELLSAADHTRLHKPAVPKCKICGKERTENCPMKRGMCSNHYQQWRRKERYAGKNLKNAKLHCRLCGALHYARGLCSKCYRRHVIDSV